MEQLQAKFNLPDFIITEIYRHVHQLCLSELIQEYHETWSSHEAGFVIYQRHYYYISYNLRFGDVGVLVRANDRTCSAMISKIYNFLNHQFIDLPAKYWYTSGNHRPDGYQ